MTHNTHDGWRVLKHDAKLLAIYLQTKGYHLHLVTYYKVTHYGKTRSNIKFPAWIYVKQESNKFSQRD